MDQMSLNLSTEPDLTSLLSHLLEDESINEEEIVTIVDDRKVEIRPTEMVFDEAYEGKEFCKRLTLRNVGKKPALVRIGTPTANQFTMTPMEQLCQLPPGLSLSRLIKLKYSTALAIHEAFVPIYINKSKILYPLNIVLNQAKVVVDPVEVDFGRIDAVSCVVSKTVVVRNEGTKNTGFCIDLGRNELELIVEPTKGVLQASESVTLKLEVMGFYEGPFQKEFWIKTTPPKRVTVIGEFLTPKIVATYPRVYADFNMIYFPRLYIGQSASRTLIIKNISSSDVMYCVKGRIDKNYYLYKNAVKADDHYKSFRLTPLEGRIGSQQTSVIEVIYEPVESAENHAVCFVQVIRVDCTDVDDSVIIRANEIPEPTAIGHTERSRSSLLPSIAIPQQTQDDVIEDEDLGDITYLVTEEKIAQSESFRVCLYGDKEKVDVRVRPEIIALNELTLQTVEIRNFWFENNSRYLPINIRYIKRAFIDVEPRNLYLNPKETKEVLMRIIAKKPGLYATKVEFELSAFEDYNYYKDKKKAIISKICVKVSFTGILEKRDIKPRFTTLTPSNHNEVGFMTHGIQFNTMIEKMKSAIIHDSRKIFPKNDTDLIAFPNDRPKSLRPWKELKPCKTIFAKIPRLITTHDEYSFPPITLIMKKKDRNYYIQYLRRKQCKLPKKKEINVEKTKRWMLKNFFCTTIGETIVKEKISAFVPLSPITLHNVKIRPKYIRLQRVAPISNVEHTFSITNENSFPIFIFVTSVKPGIYFTKGHCKIVQSKEKKVMTLTCFAGLVGRYINLIQVIINFCHLFTISVMVEVVPKMINLGENVICFEPEHDGYIKFIELQNHLNSSIAFSTEMSMSRFKIEPTSGIILQKRSLLCSVRYDNIPELPDYCELVLTSEGGGSQIVQISRKKEKPTIEIYPSRLNLNNLPFNIEKNFFIRVKNLMTYDISFIIIDPSPFRGVEIFPFQGIIESCAEMIFKITVNIDHVDEFLTKFDFLFEDNCKVSVVVDGRIILPAVDLKPETIVNRKLMPFAYRRNIFYVKNESSCICHVRFDLDQYEYFRVTEKEDEMDTTIHNENLKLLPGEVKTLYLHFNPLDAITESFYLPIILNDKIGPPTMSNTESVQYTLGEKKSKISTKLPCLRITSICSTVSLHFSTLKLTFSCSLSNFDGEQLKKFFTVRNIGMDNIEFCIRTDKMLKMFSINYHSGTEVEITNASIVCTLQSGQSTILTVGFKPTYPGSYVNELPIYVRKYLDGCIFNYLRLIGTFKKPEILTFSNIYYLPCTPIGFKSAVVLGLEMKYHDDICEISVSAPPPEVSIVFIDPTSTKHKELTITKILVLCNTSSGIFTELTFFCTCGASCTVTLIASSDNCYLSHYAFSFNYKDTLKRILEWPAKNFEEEKTLEKSSVNNEDEELDTPSDSIEFTSLNNLKLVDLADFPEFLNIYNFPFFPLQVDDEYDTDYHEEIRGVVKFIERWVCSQAFYNTKYVSIPYTIALAPIPIKRDNPKKPPSIEPTILSFLVEFGGAALREASISSKITVFNPTNIALHFFKIYTNMLRYLQIHGALLPHVFPELLLSYEYYQIICVHCPDKLTGDEIYDEEKFLSHSAQCYVDVILQSIKIFILKCLRMFDVEVRPPQDERETDERLSDLSVLTPVSYDVSFNGPNNGIYTKSEHLLLYWLQYHYDDQKNRLWKTKIAEGLSQLEPKEIKVFMDDLNDSLVFACVTVAYCPYLAPFLSDMYVPPSSHEEYNHNACTLIKAWNSLKLSYVVEPQDIMYPNSINMFLLTLYLYEILPSFFPKELFNLEAKLTEVSEADVTITNNSDHQMVYRVIFFGNDSGSFHSDTEEFRIPPKKNGNLKISYQAKKISSQKAILVLSGEMRGQKYGKSKAVLLNGITDLNHSISHYELECECYKITRKSIQLKSPYNVPDTYEIFYTITEDDMSEDTELHANFELCSWKEYILDGIPRRMFSKEYDFVVVNPEQGVKFEPILCCNMISISIYKMFMVGQHGDWSFDIRIKSKLSKQVNEIVNVPLPRAFNSLICHCKNKPIEATLACPRTIRVNIPSKNNLFYAALRDMFITCTDERYVSFWTSYLPMRAVFNILKILYSAPDPFAKFSEHREIFMKTHEFNVQTEGNVPFVPQKKVKIDDITSDKPTQILIHLNSDFNLTGRHAFLEMETDNKCWKRYYKLQFYENSDD